MACSIRACVLVLVALGVGWHSAHGEEGAVRAAAYPPAQLQRTASCLAARLDPQLEQYRQAVPLPDTYAKGPDHAVFAPVFASASLNPTSPPNVKVRQAVVFIHGAAGDANVYFCDGYAAAKAATGSVDSVLVIAPWFGNTQVSAKEWTGQSAVGANVSAFYASGHGGVGWLGGGDNSATVPSTTSFDVLDGIINALGVARVEGRFPHLERVVINGFSAGGQMVSRWAVFSPPGFYGGLPVRVIAADGSSYLYLDAKRPVVSCAPLHDTGVNHTCHQFAVPADQSVAASCTGYDQYKYGLQVAAAARSSMYLARFAENPDKMGQTVSVRADQRQPNVNPSSLDWFRTGLKSLLLSVRTAVLTAAGESQAFLHRKDVRFIFGARDVCQCNIPGYENRPDACYHIGAQCSPNMHGGTIDGHTCCDTWPDTTSSNLCAHTCEAMLQGSNRLQRGINYVAYLRQLSGNAEWPQMGFFEGGHNNSGFYASMLFKSWAYH